MPLRSGGEPILEPDHARGDLRQPPAPGASTAIRALNQDRLDATGDPEIATRIAAYEMAYRMQTSAPS